MPHDILCGTGGCVMCVMSVMCDDVQDVCDRLWDICDRRRQDWEEERSRVMEEHWMEDHLGLLVNTYINIMQVHRYIII